MRKHLGFVATFLLAVLFAGPVSASCFCADDCFSINDSREVVANAYGRGANHNGGENPGHAGFHVSGHCCHGCHQMPEDYYRPLFIKNLSGNRHFASMIDTLSFSVASGVEHPPRL
jgi:hypothetical protein